jgi:cobalt-zinc-cadmium efflux system outer membrane protein
MRSMIRYYSIIGVAIGGMAFGDAPKLEPVDTLTQRQAVDLALQRNPALLAKGFAVAAAEALTSQAKALPNPRLKVELEEFDRDGQGMDSSEGVLKLSQLVEMGGKRRARVAMAQGQALASHWDRKAERQRVRAETERRFVALSAAQARRVLAGATEAQTDRMADTVRMRVEAGKEPAFQQAKADAASELARMEYAAAQVAALAAKTALCAMWGESTPHFDAVENVLDQVPEETPRLEALVSALDGNPLLGRAESEVRVREAALATQKAARIPNVDASVAVQYFEEDGTDAVSFGVGVPLPLFDRNRGNIDAARASLRQAEAERESIRVALASELTVAHAAYVASHGRCLALRSRILPAMEKAFSAARDGHQHGKFGFLEVLDAQRGVTDAQQSLLDAMVELHTARIAVERIAGNTAE